LVSQPLYAQQGDEPSPGIYRVVGERSAPQPPSDDVKELYRSLGQRYGVSFVFDKKLGSTSVSAALNLDLDGATLEQSLDLLAKAENHLYKKVDDATYLVAEDTPQNRRELETMVVQLFQVENVPVKEVDKMLRTTIEARRISTCERTNTVLLRDTADKVRIAARLVDLLDRPQSELDIGVEILISEPGLLSQSQRSLSRQPGFSALHLRPEQLEQIRREARAVTSASTRLGVMGSDHSRYETSVAGSLLVIDVRGTAHASSNEVTLGFAVHTGTSPDPHGAAVEPAGGAPARRALRSTVRLQAGRTALLTGLGSGDHEIAIALTPLVVRTARYTAAELEALTVGTESRISLDGLEWDDAASDPAVADPAPRAQGPMRRVPPRQAPSTPDGDHDKPQ
jgi:hypothetical protein